MTIFATSGLLSVAMSREATTFLGCVFVTEEMTIRNRFLKPLVSDDQSKIIEKCQEFGKKLIESVNEFSGNKEDPQERWLSLGQRIIEASARGCGRSDAYRGYCMVSVFSNDGAASSNQFLASSKFYASVEPLSCPFCGPWTLQRCPCEGTTNCGACKPA